MKTKKMMNEEQDISEQDDQIVDNKRMRLQSSEENATDDPCHPDCRATCDRVQKESRTREDDEPGKREADAMQLQK